MRRQASQRVEAALCLRRPPPRLGQALAASLRELAAPRQGLEAAAGSAVPPPRSAQLRRRPAPLLAALWPLGRTHLGQQLGRRRPLRQRKVRRRTNAHSHPQAAAVVPQRLAVRAGPLSRNLLPPRRCLPRGAVRSRHQALADEHVPQRHRKVPPWSRLHFRALRSRHRRALSSLPPHASMSSGAGWR